MSVKLIEHKQRKKINLISPYGSVLNYVSTIKTIDHLHKEIDKLIKENKW
jgi:hypothetical protein